MAIDTTYGPEVGQIVKIMAKKPEGVVLRYPEIEEIIKLPVANPQFHRILSTAINRLAQQKIPVKKVQMERLIDRFVEVSISEVSAKQVCTTVD
jgi:hypothetical protein